MLCLFVRRELMDVETAQGMLAWPHSGFHVHDGVCALAGEREFAVRLDVTARAILMVLSRLEYQPGDRTVTYDSDKPTGPTAGSETMDVAELLRRIFEVDHVIENRSGVPGDKTGCFWLTEEKPKP